MKRLMAARLGVWSLVLAASMVGVRYLFAVAMPMTNDEAYYWDWGRVLQLSYFDHPPGVAWLTHFSQLFAEGTLAARLLSPLCHLVATLALLAALPMAERAVGSRSARTPRHLATFLLVAMTALMPGLSLWGVIALPDTPLLAALSWSMVLILRLGERGTAARELLGWREGAWLGMLLGVAGDCKYHTLVIGLGMLLALAWVRRRVFRFEWSFWLMVALGGALATTPVWLWNLRNDFASIRFQSDHGFGGLRFVPLFAARAWLGQMLLIGPAVFVGALLTLLKRPWGATPGKLIAMGAFLPLFLLIEAVAPFKQTLPHWVLPAFWLVLPFVAVDAADMLARGRGHRLWSAQFIGAALITLVLPWTVAAPWVRAQLLASRQGDPGPLAELTLWPYLAEALAHDVRWNALAADEQAPSHCRDRPYRASLRWFWTAQLAFHLPDQPQVLEFDETRTSYYYFRDAELAVSGCPVVICADRAHFDEKRLDRRVIVKSIEPFSVPAHEKMDVVLIRGIMR